MNLIVYTNWDDLFLKKIKNKSISWVCGRLPRDCVGSSTVRAKNLMANKTNNNIRAHIKKIHAMGLRFNYVLDSHCINAMERFPGGIDKIIKHIKWIESIGADGITVSIFYFIRMIKKHAPSLKIGYALPAIFWTGNNIGYFDSQGADWIILPIQMNRWFEGLKKHEQKYQAELWLIANSGCFYNCPFLLDHENFLSHVSNYSGKVKDTQYFNLNCNKMMVESWDAIVKSPWIRPEDIYLYEKLGYHNFIIEANSANTTSTVDIISAYHRRKFKGNLLSLLSCKGQMPCEGSKGLLHKKAPNLDNIALDGFLANFPNVNCVSTPCRECGYCENFTSKRLKENIIDKEELVFKYSKKIKQHF